MKFIVVATLCGALSAAAHAGTVHVGYSPIAPESNFGAPSNLSDTTAYDVITSQTATTLSVDVCVTGDHAMDAQTFSNIYLGGDTSVGIEVTNDRAFIPGDPTNTYYSLAGTGFTYQVTGSAAAGDLDIGFTLPFSFLETDPLGMGFTKLSDAPGDNFTRVSLSQSFGYSVAGGAIYGIDRLGSFTIPPAAAVPEPSTIAMFGVGLLGLGCFVKRRTTVKARLAA